MRELLLVLVLLGAWCGAAFAQEDKKADDLKPNDPDTGESTVEETTLGLLPNPFERRGIKFALTYIGETLIGPCSERALARDFVVLDGLGGSQQTRVQCCGRHPDRYSEWRFRARKAAAGRRNRNARPSQRAGPDNDWRPGDRS